MLNLNDTICNIIKTDNLNIALSEDNGNEIANILIRNKINYNLIDIKGGFQSIIKTNISLTQFSK